MIRKIAAIPLLTTLAHGSPPAAAPPAGEPGDPLVGFVSAGIAEFHARRLERKNPYLLRAKGLGSAEAIVRELLDDHLALQEASLFGFFLEQLAIHVCAEAYGGRKSAVEGIDLEFEKGGTKYLVSIKSGPNWGNSSSIAKMEDHFRRARRVLGTNTAAGTRVVAVNGCCYGRVATEDRGDYLKLAGQRFWTLISGDDSLYLRIADLVGDGVGSPPASFEDRYEATLRRFATEFAEAYCDTGGAVLWHRLIEMNSGADRPADRR